jgi:glutamate---cysteine ligase / carboxylate-amine ligase
VTVPNQPPEEPMVSPFENGGDFGIGVEEELLLVDGDGQLLGSAGGSVLAELRGEVPEVGIVQGEVFVDEVEFASRVCAGGEDVVASLRALRSSLAPAGVRAMAVGVHPSAAFGAACTASSARYDPIVDEYAGLLRTPTAAFQVHVGLPDPETAVLAYRGLRNRLPLLRALAAGSAYWHGRDSGLASARSAILRSYPRTTLPPALRSWEEYVEITSRILSAAEVPDYTYVWWDLRPQPRLGTLEVRVMDAQHSIYRAAGLATLVQGLARHAVEVPDIDDLPDDVVAANDFRACRYGLDTRFWDSDGSMRPVREIAVRAIGEARRILGPDGLDGPLDAVESMLVGPPEYSRQRRLCEERGMPALLADLVARTAELDS